MADNLLNYEGRVALITGGATGIGRAVVRGFARQGARAVIGDLDRSAEETVSLIRRDGGEG